LTEFTEKEIEVFEFLDDLRESGETNMFGAKPYVEAAFPELGKESTTYLSNWMKTFEERHPRD
jgi:hypothetical protein